MNHLPLGVGELDLPGSLVVSPTTLLVPAKAVQRLLKLYIVHRTLYMVHCTSYIVGLHLTLHIVHCTLYIVHRTL